MLKKQTFEQVLLKVASILPEYRVDEILRSGNGRSTYKAQYAKTSTQVIMKVYDILKQNNLSRVIKILRSLANKDYFLNFFELTYDKQMTQLILIEEQAQKTLRSFLKWMTEDQFLIALQQVCESVQICHQKGVHHNRIRASSVFKRGNTYVLGEPDVYQLLTSNTNYSSLPYLSLEQLEGRQSLKSDIYQIGILIYEFMNQSLPFRAKDQSGQIKLLQNELISFDLIKMNHSFSKKLNLLCLACLSIMENIRPKIGKVIEYLNSEESNALKLVPLIFESTNNNYITQIIELLSFNHKQYSVSEVTVIKAKDKIAQPYQLMSQVFFRPGKTLKANISDTSQPRQVDNMKAVDIKNLRDEFEVRSLLSKMPCVRSQQKDSLHAQRYYKRPKIVPNEDSQPDPDAYNTDRITSTRYDTVESGVQTSRPSFPRLTTQSQAKKQIFLHQILKNYVNRKEIA